MIVARREWTVSIDSVGVAQLCGATRRRVPAAARTGGPHPARGGPEPERGWRVIEVWESEEDARRFLEERLKPAFDAVGFTGRAEPELWPVHNYMT
jgi:hypothetical protein